MSFRGETVTLPIGLQGFNGSQNPSQLQPGHLSEVEGVDIDGGVLVKDGGAQKLNDTALGSGATVKSGINWDPDGTPDDVVFLDTGDVLKDTGDGSFGTSLASGLSDTVNFDPHFVVAGGESVGEGPKLFLFSETNQVQVVEGNGSSMAAIGSPPSDWSSPNFPIFGIQHGFRLWGGGNANDPHRIYYSSTSDHGDFQNGGTISIFPGEGRQLIGGISFNGALILWKYPKGIYVVDTSDASPSNWSVNKLTNAVGGSSPQSIVPIANDILFVNPSGSFHLLSSVNRFGDVTTSDIGQPADIGFFMRNNVSLVDIKKTQAVWYPTKSKAWISVPLLGSTIPDLRVVIDFAAPQIGSRFFLSRRDTLASLWIRPGTDGIERPVSGDDEGFVWLMDDDSRDKDGDTYEMQFETAEIDFGFADPTLAAINKNGAFLELTVDVITSTQVAVETLWDNKESGSIVFNVGNVGQALGTFVLDTDVLASSGTETVRRKMEGSGRRLKLRVTNDGEEDIRIAEIKAAFTRGDEGRR